MAAGDKIGHGMPVKSLSMQAKGEQLLLKYAHMSKSSLLHLVLWLCIQPLTGFPAMAGPSLGMPRFYSHRGFDALELPPQPMDCANAALLLDTHGIPDYRQLLEPDLREVQDFASTEMQNERGWPAPFIRDRYKVAFEFRGSSKYWKVLDKITGKIVGTLGMSWGGPTLPIPLEKTLGIHLEGFRVELRTYAINHSEPAKVFSALYAAMLADLYEMIRSAPELADQSIVYTYVDSTSKRLYSPMGFKLREDITPKDKPISVEGIDWWVMSTSPKTLEALVRRAPQVGGLAGFNRIIDFHVDGVGNFRIMPGTQASTSFDGGPAHIGALAEVTKLSNGLVADRGSHLIWNSDKSLHAISRLAEQADLGGGIIAAKGAYVAFYPGGLLFYISKLAHPVRLANGQRAKTGQSLMFSQDGKEIHVYKSKHHER